jgi:glycosyltransferase involved in cell wall biosynthesis
MMRLLVLSAWWPAPADNGIRLRLTHLLRALAGAHEVHLASLVNGAPSAADRAEVESMLASAVTHVRPAEPPRARAGIGDILSAEPASVRADWSPEFVALVRERAAALRPDAVVAFELSVAPYALHVPDVPRLLDDPEMLLIASQYTNAPTIKQKLRALPTLSRHRSYVGRLLEGFDACTPVSAEELAAVRSLGHPGLRLDLLPNGADIAGALDVHAEPEPDTLIYPGALTYHANFDAMHYFLGEIFPRILAARPGARLRITGKSDPALVARLPKVANVELTGFVQDVRPLVAASWCEVIPLRVGAGTRLKALEAMALGTPLVSTSKGVEGIDLTPGTHALIADDPASFAAQVVRLLEHPELREQIVAPARRFVTERYDWRSIGAKLNQLIDAVVHDRTPHRAARAQAPGARTL